jgi:hypothetical protein
VCRACRDRAKCAVIDREQVMGKTEESSALQKGELRGPIQDPTRAHARTHAHTHTHTHTHTRQAKKQGNNPQGLARSQLGVQGAHQPFEGVEPLTVCACEDWRM